MMKRCGKRPVSYGNNWAVQTCHDATIWGIGRASMMGTGYWTGVVGSQQCSAIFLKICRNEEDSVGY